jgi:hypothetical protein
VLASTLQWVPMRASNPVVTLLIVWSDWIVMFPNTVEKIMIPVAEYQRKTPPRSSWRRGSDPLTFSGGTERLGPPRQRAPVSPCSAER